MSKTVFMVLEYSIFQSDDFQHTVSALLEMFPYSCTLEVTHCLQLMAGDVESTAQLIMHRHENGQDLKPTDKKVCILALIGYFIHVDKKD